MSKILDMIDKLLNYSQIIDSIHDKGLWGATCEYFSDKIANGESLKEEKNNNENLPTTPQGPMSFKEVCKAILKKTVTLKVGTLFVVLYGVYYKVELYFPWIKIPTIICSILIFLFSTRQLLQGKQRSFNPASLCAGLLIFLILLIAGDVINIIPKDKFDPWPVKADLSRREPVSPQASLPDNLKNTPIQEFGIIDRLAFASKEGTPAPLVFDGLAPFLKTKYRHLDISFYEDNCSVNMIITNTSTQDIIITHDENLSVPGTIVVAFKNEKLSYVLPNSSILLPAGIPVGFGNILEPTEEQMVSLYNSEADINIGITRSLPLTYDLSKFGLEITKIERKDLPKGDVFITLTLTNNTGRRILGLQTVAEATASDGGLITRAIPDEDIPSSSINLYHGQSVRIIYHFRPVYPLPQDTQFRILVTELLTDPPIVF